MTACQSPEFPKIHFSLFLRVLRALCGSHTLGFAPVLVILNQVNRMQRISVVGTSGSGKTTLAKALAQRLEYAHIELDALHWEPDWQMAPLDLFRTRVAQAVSRPYWVTDGNYSKVRDIVWARADTVVWLDYPLPLILWRLWWRTLRRTFLRQPLWNENRESFRTSFFSRNSVIWWAITTYPRRRREYPELLARPEYSHLQTIHLHSPRQTQRWLKSVTKSP
jgi:adenylate kinase family enzyme